MQMNIGGDLGQSQPFSANVILASIAESRAKSDGGGRDWTTRSAARRTRRVSRNSVLWGKQIGAGLKNALSVVSEGVCSDYGASQSRAQISWVSARHVGQWGTSPGASQDRHSKDQLI